MIELRKYQPADCVRLTELFYDTVHRVNSRDYSTEQVAVWADGQPNLVEWQHRFISSHTVVALDNNLIVGFGNCQNGYLDCLYVDYRYQHQGIATLICEQLEQNCNTNRITTMASLTARTFFEKRDYQVIKSQQVQRQQIKLTNYVMLKKLNN